MHERTDILEPQLGLYCVRLPFVVVAAAAAAYLRLLIYGNGGRDSDPGLEAPPRSASQGWRRLSHTVIGQREGQTCLGI